MDLVAVTYVEGNEVGAMQHVQLVGSVVETNDTFLTIKCPFVVTPVSAASVGNRFKMLTDQTELAKAREEKSLRVFPLLVLMDHILMACAEPKEYVNNSITLYTSRLSSHLQVQPGSPVAVVYELLYENILDDSSAFVQDVAEMWSSSKDQEILRKLMDPEKIQDIIVPPNLTKK